MFWKKNTKLELKYVPTEDAQLIQLEGKNIFQGSEAFYLKKSAIDNFKDSLFYQFFNLDQSIDEIYLQQNLINVRFQPQSFNIDEEKIQLAKKIASFLKSHASDLPLTAPIPTPKVIHHSISQPTTSAKSKIEQKINIYLKNNIAPQLASHGGSVELVDFKEGKVYLKFSGGCQGCGQVISTLRDGIEKSLKAAVPEIQEVIDTTNHSEGSNPYF